MIEKRLFTTLVIVAVVESIKVSLIQNFGRCSFSGAPLPPLAQACAVAVYAVVVRVWCATVTCGSTTMVPPWPSLLVVNVEAM